MNSTGAGPPHHCRHIEPYFCSAHSTVYYTPRATHDRRSRAGAIPTFPTPLIRPRQRRPHSIHIVSYPPGFVPHDLRQKPSSLGERSGKEQKSKGSVRKNPREGNKREKHEKRRSIQSLPSAKESSRYRVLEKLFAALSITKTVPSTLGRAVTPPPPRPRSRASNLTALAPSILRVPALGHDLPEAEALLLDADINMDSFRSPLVAAVANAANRNNIMPISPVKYVMSSSITEVQKPVASGSGMTCSILLAEPTIFLTGFDHDGHSRHENHNSSALLRGKLQLSVSKTVKIKSVMLKFSGKARTEWPEGIPPLKADLYEEETLRTQNLVFFHAMHESDSEYGNQCTYTLASNNSPGNLKSSLAANHSSISVHLGHRSRQSNTLSPKELKRLSLQSVKSRSFGKGESPLPNQTQAKGYKLFHPGTYEYSFEIPIDHHQLETIRLQYGSVKWELEAVVERAGAFKPNLHGTKEVVIIRVPDQLSLETTEPISISRQWEDQLHYDIIISGKSFPIGARIPIAFKLTPLAKVQVHKLKVFVTESIEYWTNDRKVTRKDSGRRILLLEKTAGKPLDKQFRASDVQILSGGELGPEQRADARRSAEARRAADAANRNGVPEPLPDPAENLLGDLDLGLETFWGSTELEMNVQVPTCEMMARDKTLRLHPDCSWKNVNVYHWIKIVMRISRSDSDDPSGKRRRHFEISIDSPFTVLDCHATQANTSLPQYGQDSLVELQRQQQRLCGCPDAGMIERRSLNSRAHLNMMESDNLSPTTASYLRLNRVNSSALPVIPQAAHLQAATSNGNSAGQGSSPILSRARNQHPISNAGSSSGMVSTGPRAEPRPMHIFSAPSYLPPAFDADDPPPPAPLEIMTPPPNYDLIVGTPSVDGLADYFARLADYDNPSRHAGGASVYDQEPEASGAVYDDDRTPEANNNDGDFFSGRSLGENSASTEDEDSSDSADEDPARPHRRGRVNVVNPRTPGGRLVPSRSLEIERPVLRLNMAGVVRRNE